MARPLRAAFRDESGSAVVEFTLVSVILVALAVAVLQLALALHVRNTVLDAAAEGARYAALADNGLADGVARTRTLITAALGPGYAVDVDAGLSQYGGHPSTRITVRSALPLAGLLGPAHGLEVVGHAALETLG